jgi:hypothetical protein
MGLKKYTATVIEVMETREVTVMAESIAEAIPRVARKAQGFRPSSHWRWNAEVRFDGRMVWLERGALYRRVGPDSWAKFGPTMTIEILKPEAAS